jgi:hypothetical protein
MGNNTKPGENENIDLGMTKKSKKMLVKHRITPARRVKK